MCPASGPFEGRGFHLKGPIDWGETSGATAEGASTIREHVSLPVQLQPPAHQIETLYARSA